MTGDLALAEAELRPAIDAYDPAQHRHEAARTRLDLAQVWKTR